MLVAIICLGVTVNAENGDYCDDDGVRIELYSNGIFQLKLPGEDFIRGTYEIDYEEATITLIDSDGSEFNGRYYRGVYYRNGQIKTPAKVVLWGYTLKKDAC